MGGEGRNAEGDRGISSHDCYMDCGDECEEGKQRIMRVGLDGHGIGDHGDLANKGVFKDGAGNSRRICIKDTYIQTLYRLRGDLGVR